MFALEEAQRLIMRLQYIQEKYNVTNEHIYDIEYWLSKQKEKFKRMQKITNEEIKKYPIFMVNKLGGLVRIHSIKSTNDYSRACNLHHYIPFSIYSKDPEWFEKRGIKQKLILMSIPLHEQVHHQAVKVLSDAEFERRYRISRWELIFNKKHSKYESEVRDEI